MRMKNRAGLTAAALLVAAGIAGPAQAAPYMIVGNDEKILWDDEGKPILSAPGKDSVLIVDLANPEEPKIVGNLPLKNSVVGPPVNLDIDPTGTIALVADSIEVTKEGETLKQAPGNKVYVIDLKASPPKARLSRPSRMTATRAAATGRRRAHLRPRSQTPAGRARIGSPATKRCRSSARASALT